ncbi:MAG: nucleotide exchange factor GrpE [Dehalococcoidia bacterium]|nr:MAG: nucleotide exchange factor GrpE [Dehalococcoidia bacterium]
MLDPRFEDMPERGEIRERPEELEPVVNIAALKQEIIDAKAKAQEYLEGWQRGQADFVNFKKRLEQDKIDAAKYANAGLILKILPVLDDFERAVGAVPPSMAKEPWVGGINGIARKLESVLESVGLTAIKAQGEFFDPNLHEASGSAPGPEGLVVMELEKGYKLADRVLRPARVMVGNGEGDSENESSMEE